MTQSDQGQGSALALPRPPIVARLRFEGVQAVDESELRRALSTRQSPLWPWRERRRFDKEVFQADLDRIAAFYAKHGYPHARVVGTEVREHGDAVTITITISEGEPERVVDLDFTGLDGFSETFRGNLERLAPLRRGMPLSESAATATAQLVVNVLGEAGYPHARAEIRKARVGEDQARVDVHADRGPLGYFGPITIAGNIHIDDDVIRRQVAYLPGRRFDAAAMRETRRRLVALDLFESVSVQVTGTDASAETPTLVVVKEADLNQVSYSFGYGSEEQLNTDVAWRHRNFLGGGRTAGTRGRWSSIDRGGEGTFIQPFFVMPRLSLQLNGHVWQVDQPSYDTWLSGGVARLDYARGAHDGWGADYLHEFQHSRLSDGLRASAPSARERNALGLNQSDDTQSGMLAQVALDYSRDTTANEPTPRHGSRVLIRIEKAGGWLPGAFAYYNALATGRAYRGLGRMTLAGRVQTGFITTPGDSPLPFAKRYFLGGADTLRGWGRLEVSPLSEAGVPVGGTSMLLFNAELRAPVVPRLLAVLFADAGNVWSGAWTVRPNPLLFDVGAGVRVASPVGPLRLDIGYQLTPIAGLRVDGDPQSRRWRLHFSSGQAF